ncbi:hypothetical protein B0H11DRAFT_2229588 [Mycena galericulata]|nr:hypothetical protein B0H11DRAFT_2229588 [Mycena galericulata]
MRAGGRRLDARARSASVSPRACPVSEPEFMCPPGSHSCANAPPYRERGVSDGQNAKNIHPPRLTTSRRVLARFILTTDVFPKIVYFACPLRPFDRRLKFLRSLQIMQQGDALLPFCIPAYNSASLLQARNVVLSGRQARFPLSYRVSSFQLVELDVGAVVARKGSRHHGDQIFFANAHDDDQKRSSKTLVQRPASLLGLHKAHRDGPGMSALEGCCGDARAGCSGIILAPLVVWPTPTAHGPHQRNADIAAGSERFFAPYPAKTDFDAIHGVLRLGTKYRVDRLPGAHSSTSPQCTASSQSTPAPASRVPTGSSAPLRATAALLSRLFRLYLHLREPEVGEIAEADAARTFGISCPSPNRRSRPCPACALSYGGTSKADASLEFRAG